MIPTAKEFLRIFKSKMGLRSTISPLGNEGTEKEVMIEFAKLHVKAALKAKVDAMKDEYQSDYSIGELDCFTEDAYPLTNIK